MEQHLSVCPLERVACEMKEFGCSVVVPRNELARHMRESELQHQTTMGMLNLRLTRQLLQDSAEKDRKIAQLQQMIELQTNMMTKMNESLLKIQADLRMKTDEACSGCEVFTFTRYQSQKYYDYPNDKNFVESDPFYSHYHGYKFKLKIVFHGKQPRVRTPWSQPVGPFFIPSMVLVHSSI